MNWIEIERFRGFNKVKIENFDKVNIFVGKNNVGKSTILEAIYLIETFDVNSFSEDFFGNVPISFLEEFRKRRYDEYWAYKKRFPIIIRKESKELRLDEHIPPYHATRSEVAFLYPEALRRGSFAKKVRSFIADFGVEAIKKVIKFYSEYLNLEDLEYIEERGDSIFFVFSDRAVPFELVGDGIKISFPIISLCTFMENGTIIIEEPETYQHPKSLEMIVEAISKSKARIFISTHSIEFLEMLLEKNRNNIAVFRLKELKNGILSYKRYSGEEAFLRVNEIGVDLR